MTGIERLRELVDDEKAYGYSSLSIILSYIADQIERERACDGDTIENVRLIVGGVIDDMERHCLGVEGMEDSPVARWARELREALGGDKHDPAKDVSMSAYDLLPEDEREAIALVREHGGLEDVRAQLDVWQDVFSWAVELGGVETCHEAARWVREHGGLEEMRRMFQDADNRRVELCAALGIDLDKGWSEAMAAMRLRLMPEGMEWPRFEDGEPVRIGDAIVDELGHAHEVSSVEVFDDAEALHWIPSEPEDFVWLVHGERVKRPTPKVLDADGAEVRVGDKLYDIKTGFGRTVRAINANKTIEFDGYVDRGWLAKFFTHRAPVLAADGRPLREGETVFNERGDKFTVSKVDHERGVFSATATFDGREGINFSPIYFSHEHIEHKRPEIDSWERLEDDATVSPETYCVIRGIDISDVDGTHLVLDDVTEWMARDLVRRAKKLAGDA